MIDFGVTAVRDHGHHDQCLAATLDALDDDQVAAVAAGALRDPRFVQHAGGAVLETLEMIDPDSPYTYETGSVDVVVDRHDGIGVDLILDLSPAETARLARGCEWPGLAPTTKSTVRERLAGLTDPQAAEAALLTLGGGWVWQAYGDAISDSVDGYLSHLAEDPDTDPELLSRLAAHPDRAVRERFAAHPNMPAAARSHIGLLDD